MTKTEAIRLLGGTQAAAAMRIGVTFQAIGNWPEELSDKLRDRVQAVLWREYERSCLEGAARRAKARERSANKATFAVEPAAATPEAA